VQKQGKIRRIDRQALIHVDSISPVLSYDLKWDGYSLLRNLCESIPEQGVIVTASGDTTFITGGDGRWE
jgi:hypothetical protein